MRIHQRYTDVLEDDRVLQDGYADSTNNMLTVVVEHRGCYYYIGKLVVLMISLGIIATLIAGVTYYWIINDLI